MVNHSIFSFVRSFLDFGAIGTHIAHEKSVIDELAQRRTFF